jgi:Fe-S cluster biogenesis protein NfuA
MARFNVVSIKLDGANKSVVGYDGGCGCCEDSQRLTKAQLQEFIDDLEGQLAEAKGLLERDDLFD